MPERNEESHVLKASTQNERWNVQFLAMDQYHGSAKVTAGNADVLKQAICQRGNGDRRSNGPPSSFRGPSKIQSARKTHVADQNRIRSGISSALVDAANPQNQNPGSGVLDLHAILNEARKKGIDLTKHYSANELYHGPSISTSSKYNDFNLGQIVIVPHLVPSLDSNIAANDQAAVWSWVGPLCVKRRPAVVVAIYQDRMVVLPMYTHNKNGVANKSPSVQELALHLVAGEIGVETPRDRVLTCDTLPFGNTCGTSIVYATDPYSVSYGWPLGIQYSGRLDEPSTSRLLSEYAWYQEASKMDIGRQREFIRSKRLTVSTNAITAGMAKVSMNTNAGGWKVVKSRA